MTQILIPASPVLLLGGLLGTGDIINLATSFITLLLGIATVWMAIETRRMANAAKDAVVLDTQPCLSVRGFNIAYGDIQFPADTLGKMTPSFAVILVLTNPGKVRVQYKIVNTSLSMDGCGPYNPDYKNTLGVIFPGEQVQIFLAPLKLVDQFTLKSKGSLSVELGYWSSEQDKKKLTLKSTIQISSLDPFTCTFMHEEGSPFYI